MTRRETELRRSDWIVAAVMCLSLSAYMTWATFSFGLEEWTTFQVVFCIYFNLLFGTSGLIGLIEGVCDSPGAACNRLVYVSVILLMIPHLPLAPLYLMVISLFNSLLAFASSGGKKLISRIPTWPRSWSLFAFLLPKSVREKVWEPAVADLVESYANRKHFRGKWARRWINFCLAIRTAILVFECLAWMIPDRAIRLLFPRSK